MPSGSQALKAIFSADTSEFKRGIIEMERMSAAAAKRMMAGTDWVGKGPEGLNARAKENARQIALNRNRILNLVDQERELATASAAIDRQRSTAADVEAASRSNRARRLLRQRAQMHAEAAQEAYRASFRGRIGEFFSGVAGTFIGIGAALGAVYKFVNFLRDSVRVQIELQRMYNTLKTVSGSSKQATEDMKFLFEASNKLGFSFLESGAAFARFSAAATASGLTMQKTRSTFLAVQEAALVMGMSTDQTASVMLALEQMLSKGTVMSQELRLQLGNSMPGAMNIFARALGLGIDQLYKMVEDGLVPAKEAVALFGMELQKSFTLTPEANKTMRELQRMTNAIIQMKGAVGKGLAPEVEGVAQNIAFWARQMGEGKTTGAVLRGLNPLSLMGYIAEQVGGFRGSKIDVKAEAEAKLRKDARLNRDMEVERGTLREAIAKKFRDKDAAEAAKIEEKVAEKRREREIQAMPHAKRLEMLRAQVAAAERATQEGPLTQEEMAKRQLTVEERREDLLREQQKREQTNAHMNITEQERHGGGFGLSVRLLDVNQRIHREVAAIHRVMVSGRRGGGVNAYFGRAGG